MFNIQIAKDIENIISWNLMFLFILSIAHLQLNDNIKSVICIDNSLNKIENHTIYRDNVSDLISFNLSEVNNKDYIDDYRMSFLNKNKLLSWITLIIYFIVIPFLNIFYGFWCLKNDLLIPKGLYNSISLKFRGV